MIPEDLPDVLRAMLEAYCDVRITEEVEATKRAEIRARSEEALARIAAQRALLTDYLERSFDERASNFERLFKLADRALLDGNLAALTSSLAAVTEIARSSPFKDLASLEATRRAMLDSNHEWEV